MTACPLRLLPLGNSGIMSEASVEAAACVARRPSVV